jgi:ribosome-associated protein
VIDLGFGIAVPEAELRVRTTRSGGPGGQNVNKVETRVELVWDIQGSPSLDERLRTRLLQRLASRLDSEGRLRLVAAEHRSQARNRDEVMTRLREVVRVALTPQRRRIATRPSRGSKLRRMDAKREQGEKKRRRRPDFDP